jgi:hypothetical protein
MSMARLWRDQGKRDAARDLLAPVYGWFTEGSGFCLLLTRHRAAATAKIRRLPATHVLL